MELEYSTMSSEHSSDSSDISQESTHLEECHIARVQLQLPQGLCENKNIFKEFFSSRIWHEHFTEQQRQHLKTFLPDFPENSAQEKEETIRRLFARENMRFGSPLTDFQEKLKNGYYKPDIAKMRSVMKKAQIREYKYQQRQYYFCLMKEILLSRQQLLETAFSQPPGVLPKMERIPNNPPPRSSPAEQRTRRRYFQELAAVRQEVGESDHSSEDENYPEGPPPKMSKKQKRQLATLECSLSPDMNHVISTVALKPSGFDLESNITSNYNPYEMNEDLYKVLLMNHKRRRMECDDHPELNILGITTQDISNRAQLGKRPIVNRIQSVGYDPKVSSKKKSKGETRGTPTMVVSHISQLKHSLNSPQTGGGYSSNGSDIMDSEEEEGILDHSLVDDMERVDVEGEIESPISASKASPSAGIRTPVASNRNRCTNSSGSSPRTSRTSTSSIGVRSLLQRRIKVEAEEESSDPYPDFSISPNENVYQSHSNSVTTSTYSGKHMTAATLSDLDGIDMMNIPVELADAAPDTMQINIDIKPAPELMQDTHACFFSLIRDVICSTPDHRMALATLEDRLKAWQENPISPLNDWYSLAESWLVMLTSAISFLSGDFPDAQPEDFVPYVEYKPNVQAYQWIGAGRDSDSHLQPLCQHWLDHRDEMTSRPIKEEEVEEEGDGGGEERVVSPPPPRCPTTWVVHASTPEEKECFREQERLRYENPHRAFTFRMHNYESVVGPVKGVYNQSIGMNKPRGHSLLVADRPNFVTILALVRDATARLPNGEGTRTDICELLKDSQYLAPVSQESYLHSVVSGALDRLHCETDPCVKYDTKRKIWIYLHRGRTEEEFERLHQQQQGMAKTKKSSSQRKASRSKQQKDAAAKEPASPLITSTAAVTMTTTTTTETAQLSVPNTESLTSVATVHSSPVQTGLPALTTSAPVIASSVKPTAARNPRMPLIQRTYTLAPGQNVPNLQVSTPPGIQTIQVSTTPSVLAGKSLLTTVVTQQQQQQQLTTSIVKTVAVTSQATTHVSTNSATPVLKTVTLTPQQMQAMNAARGITVASLRDPNTGVAVRMPTSSLVGTIASSSPTTTTEVTSAVTSVVTSSCGIQQQKASVTSRSTVQSALASPKTLVNVTSPQVMNMSQVQLVGSKSPQAVGSPKPVLSAAGKTLVTAGLSGMKLVNAMKADGSQQQTIFIKQPQTDQQPQTVIGTVQQQPQLLQHPNKQAAAITHLQQQLKQQLQQKQQQQAVTVGVSTATSSAQRVVTTMSVLSSAQCQARVMARVGGKPIPVSHMAVQQQQQPGAGGQSLTGASGTTVMKPQQPMVAKVLTSTQGQVISMESLVAHQKQHGTLPQGTALRVTAGGKPGQASLIQIPSSTQFAVVSQGNLLSVGQSRVLQAQLPSQQVHSPASGIQQQAVTIQQQAQTQAAKLVTAAGKPLAGGTASTATANLRMLGPASGGLTMTQIGGKPVLVASKTQTTPIQSGVGQNVILTSQATGGHQTVVLASQALRAQGGTLLLQQGGTQQILLPPGFQGGTLNIKTLQGLQGLKVIPLSQATAAATNKGRQQVYARIISPGVRPAATSIVHQNAGTAATLQSTNTDATTSNTQLGTPSNTDQ